MSLPKKRALVFATFIGLMGLLPHLLFSLNVGSLHYLNSAWDEDSYTKYLLTHHDVVYRLFSHTLLRIVHSVLGLDWAIISMDTFLPAVAAVIAVVLAHALGFNQRKHWFFAAFFMLFPLEMLAFCHPYFWQEFVMHASPFAGPIYPSWFREFVPSVFQNFFSIYKASEPQFTIIFHLFALWALLRYTQTLARRYALMLIPVALVLPFIYITTGISLLLFVGGYAVLGLLLTPHRRYWLWLLATGITAGYVGAAHLLFPNTFEGPAFLFHSRLPIIGGSMVYGLLGLLLVYRTLLGHLKFRRTNPPEYVLLLIAAFAVPIIALNQQLITGVMVQSRTWEYYSNYPFVAFGILLVWPQIMVLLKANLAGRVRRSAKYVLPIIILLFVVAQFMTYKAYQKSDLLGLALSDGVKAAGDFDGYVLLDNPDHDSQVWLRTGNPDLKILAGYQEIIAHPIPVLGDEKYDAAYDYMKEQAFTLFDRKGHTPYELQELITNGIGTGGWYVRYFFALLDCWYPLSDFRLRNPDAMLARVPDIVADYQEFLNDPKRRNQFGELLYITEAPIQELREVPWVNHKVAMVIEGKWRQKTVYVYKQTPLEK